MKILFATDILPQPDKASGDRRFFAIIKHVASSHDVYLLINRATVDAKETQRYLADLRAIGVRTVYMRFSRAFMPFCLHRYELAIFEFYDTYLRLGPDFRLAQPATPILIDTVDIHFARHGSGLKIGDGDSARFMADKLAEISAYNSADGLITITDEDAALLETEHVRQAQWKIANIVPIVVREKCPRSPMLLFVGGFSHTPNVDGILWFMSSIWPRVKASIPAVELYIVGSNPPESVQALRSIPGVTVTGFVKDTEPFLQRAAVSIAPLRYGAGMKGKVSEAMAAGVPVVTTSYGAQGFNARSGEHLYISDTEEGFSSAVVYLLQNEATAMSVGAAGQALVEQICSERAVAHEITGMILAASRIRGASAKSSRVHYLLLTFKNIIIRRLHGAIRALRGV